MDVDHQLGKVVLGGNGDAIKRTFEECACPLVGFVDGFGVGVEQIGELLAGILAAEDRPSRLMRALSETCLVLVSMPGFLFIDGLGAYQEVKMIPQQAIGIRIGYGYDVLGVEPEEIGVVTLFDKDILPVITTVVDVVIRAIFQPFGHRHSGGTQET